MSKHFFISITFFSSSILMIFFAPATAFAAHIDFKIIPNEIPGDRATIVEARVNPEGKSVNAIEGVLLFQKAEGVEISSIVTETGDSVFTLWPREPRYSDEEGSIRFTGGTPHGFNDPSLLFRMRIFTIQPGMATLSLLSGTIYRDDGSGTPENISSRSLTISLTQSTPNPINPSSADSQPPIFESVEIGQDPDVFDGNVFLSFHALDNLSGIDHYEISENGTVTNTSSVVYVLRDQTRNTRIVVTAFDKAGNSTSVEVPPKYARITYLTIVFVILILCCAIFFLRRKICALTTKWFV